MSSFKSVFSPELRAKLGEKKRYLAAAQKAVSQFARFPGPDDEYYFRLAKVTARADRKSGGYKFNFKFICVANKKTRSAEYAGAPMNVTFRCFATKNSSEEDNWNRFYTDGLQALGIQTNKWPASETEELLDQALAMLDSTKPPVVLSIRTDGQYQNANIVEVLRSDALDEFAQPSLEVDDEMPEDHPDDEGLSAEDQQLKQLADQLQSLDRAKLEGALAQQKIPFAISPLTTDDQIREAIYRHFEAQLKPPASPAAVPASSAPSHPAQPAQSEAEESLEEVEESLEDEMSLSDQAALKIAKLERKPIQRAIKKLDSAFKFFPSQSDDLLREALLQKLTQAGEAALADFVSVPF